MSRYIDADKLIAEIERLDEKYRSIRVDGKLPEARGADLVIKVLRNLSITITSLQQEQPNKSFCEENCKGYRETGGKCFFGFNCSVKKAYEQPEVYLEKAARNVYESWMGGTMNDFRRDVVELGKVLNARKEESL